MYEIGEVIKKTRESLGLTQEELSDGICAVPTLSKIENGRRAPSWRIVEALMERMGKSGERYVPRIHSEDIKLHDMSNEIRRSLGSYQCEKAEALLKEFEVSLDMEDKVNLQFVTRVKAYLEWRAERINEEEQRKMLEKALRYTIPQYKEGILPKGVFSKTEMTIFCNIASTYMHEGNLDQAIHMLRQAKKYFENLNMSQEERAGNQAHVLDNLAQSLGRKGEYQEALEIEEKNLQICLQMREGTILPYILYHMAYIMEKLNMNQNICKERLIQAYYSAEFFGNENSIMFIRKHMMEVYGEIFIC